MKRRNFLSLAGGFAGYSVLVKADGIGAEPPSHDAIASQFDRIAPTEPARDRFAGEPHMTLVDLDCDVFVAGGGMAGVCAAIAAARHGAKVVLVQDRSRLGGNASSEVKMHIVGANCHGGRPGWREGGLIEEFRLDDAVNNPHRSFELWDLLLYDKVKREPNITLLLDTTLFAAEMKDGLVLEHSEDVGVARTASSGAPVSSRLKAPLVSPSPAQAQSRLPAGAPAITSGGTPFIQRVLARCDKTEHLYRIVARQFLDCTGDCRLALEAGAEMRQGREAKSEFGESLAYATADSHTQGSSILFTARDYGRPIPFKPPVWARKVTKEMLKFRGVSSWEYGYWWIEWGGQLNSIRDNERIRFELLSIVLGVWDYIKNSGDQPDSANWGMDWIGFIPGKRESRRLVGDYVLTQADLEGQRGEPKDAVAIGGWPMDDHPPSGFDAWTERPFRSVPLPEVYSIPLRCLYSRNVGNLWMAGRNISASHAAFSSTRVMATCSAIGQAAGTAAALCVRHGLKPRGLFENKDQLRELQQALLRDDQTLKGWRNEDRLDLARLAKVTASTAHDISRPELVVDGFVRNLGRQWTHRWGAKFDEGEPWLDLAWEKPQRIGQVQITFDTGFHRELTLSASDATNRQIIRGPQPETVRDYTLSYRPAADGDWRELVRVRGNHQRLVRHSFAPVDAQVLRLQIQATNGDAIARVYELRVYA